MSRADLEPERPFAIARTAAKRSTLQSVCTLAVFALALAGCSGATTSSTPATGETSSPRTAGALVDADGDPILPPPPNVPDGVLSPEVQDDLDALFTDITLGLNFDAAERIGSSGDARLAWLLTDLMRFIPAGPNSGLADAFEALTGFKPEGPQSIWNETTNALIAWDIPAPPNYTKWKRIPFELVEPRWAPFFDDENSEIEWRIYSWGGVLLDGRDRNAADQPCPRGCIPALNDPATTTAAGGDWYADDRTVFGIVVDGEARAYPKNIMEVHEMVNTTLGGRRVAIPYCTLCGSAQAYVTDNVEGFDTLEIRTSGLLARSNKVMFDLDNRSVFDTFTGRALSGPLHDAGVTLEQLTVVTSTWADWKVAHPDTTIVAQDGGIGRIYPDDPLRGRDDDGPIFPVGDVDPRLGVHEAVIGVVTADGTALALPTDQIRAAIAAGESPGLNDIVIQSDGGGFRAEQGGTEIATHESFWFAWSQFHPDTLLWQR
ncbi:MAG: DUF3179 domain-containing (seleno)protein [Acidimicrobiales bacterium]